MHKNQFQNERPVLYTFISPQLIYIMH